MVLAPALPQPKETKIGPQSKDKIREYKDTPRPMGIYQIKNKVNGKILIGSSVNLPAMLNRSKAELKMGSYRNIVLQKEWKQFGFENFEFKELEILEPTDDPTYDPAEDLHVLETLWIEKLSPFGWISVVEKFSDRP